MAKRLAVHAGSGNFQQVNRLDVAAAVATVSGISEIKTVRNWNVQD